MRSSRAGVVVDLRYAARAVASAPAVISTLFGAWLMLYLRDFAAVAWIAGAVALVAVMASQNRRVRVCIDRTAAPRARVRRARIRLRQLASASLVRAAEHAELTRLVDAIAEHDAALVSRLDLDDLLADHARRCAVHGRCLHYLYAMPRDATPRARGDCRARLARLDDEIDSLAELVYLVAQWHASRQAKLALQDVNARSCARSAAVG